jgi:cytoskeletal protein RodZ
MTELGEKLKQARQARRVSLREIEAATKISVGALEALERGDYSKLPGGIFSRSFVRAYAHAVGLDEDAVVGEFAQDFARWQKDAERNVKRPEITADDREFVERQRKALRTLRIVLVVAAIGLIALVTYAVLVWWPRPVGPEGGRSAAAGAVAAARSRPL